MMSTKLMKHNEGSLDRGFRILLGLGLLSLVFVGPQTLFGLVGLVPLITGLLGSCPMYTLFGWSSCSLKAQSSKS